MPPKLSSLSDRGVWLYFGLCLVLGVGFAVIYSRITRKRGLSLLEGWARLHQFTITSVRQPLIVPFWKSGRGFQWFRVVIRDASGAARQCWIRCQDFAAAPDSIEVIWDEKPSA
jgi:hypothetical protein